MLPCMCTRTNRACVCALFNFKFVYMKYARVWCLRSPREFFVCTHRDKMVILLYILVTTSNIYIEYIMCGVCLCVLHAFFATTQTIPMAAIGNCVFPSVCSRYALDSTALRMRGRRRRRRRRTVRLDRLGSARPLWRPSRRVGGSCCGRRQFCQLLVQLLLSDRLNGRYVDGGRSGRSGVRGTATADGVARVGCRLVASTRRAAAVDAGRRWRRCGRGWIWRRCSGADR